MSSFKALKTRPDLCTIGGFSPHTYLADSVPPSVEDFTRYFDNFMLPR